MHRILITGAAGNLGGKLVEAFAGASWCAGIVAVDRPEALQARASSWNAAPWAAAVQPCPLDLASPDPAATADALAGVDTIIHFAVLNPAPDASWDESARSLGMTARLLLAARDAGLRRFVFASSNHTVGGLKEAGPLPAGSLTTEVVAPGTRFRTASGDVDHAAYGASKAFTEQLCMAAAQPAGLSTVSVRIGWCQKGENRPETLSAAGGQSNPEAGATSAQEARDLAWFRNMWLSNRDFVALFERAILADSTAWPQPGIVVNGMSANAGMPWDIETTRRLLGYEPQDDVWAALAR